MEQNIILTVVLTLFYSYIGTAFRCPSHLPNSKGKVSLSATNLEGGYSVKWVTLDTHFVDLVNLETVCYPEGTIPKEDTTIFLSLSEIRSGVRNFTVDSSENIMECRILGCFIDSDWGDAHAIEPVIVKVGSEFVSSSLSMFPSSSLSMVPSSSLSTFPSPSPSLSLTTTCSTIVATMSAVRQSPTPTCVCSRAQTVHSVSKRSSTSNTERSSTSKEVITTTSKDVFVELCLIFLVLLTLIIVIIILILEIKKIMPRNKCSNEEQLLA